MSARFIHRLRHYVPVWLTLVAGLALSGALGWELHREAVALDRQRLALRVKEIMDQLDTRVEKTELLLRQLQDFLQAGREITPTAFRDWIVRHDPPVNFPWLMGVAVATNLHPGAWRGGSMAPPATWTREEHLRLKSRSTRPNHEFALGLRYSARKELAWPDARVLEASYRTGVLLRVIRSDKVLVTPTKEEWMLRWPGGARWPGGRRV